MKHVEDSNKHIIEEIVRQVVYLLELFLQLFLYVTPHVKMPSVVRDILLCDMYGISSNLGDQLCTRLETESSKFRNLVS